MSAYDIEAQLAKAEKDKRDTGHAAHLRKIMFEQGLPTAADENFKDTPTRWLRYLQSYIQPYYPEIDLGVTFPLKTNQEDIFSRAVVIQAGIPYRAMCAHHLLPVLGTAHVGYIPKKRVVGLSKLARLVYGISHAIPSLQEDVCDQITSSLMQYLEPEGAICVISAEHGCMAARGVEEATGTIETVTSSLKGLFQTDPAARAEFYQLVKLGSK